MHEQRMRYLMPPADSFWRWCEMQEAAVWYDGRTIAFREELLGVLKHLAPQGLPPLGAVLLLIAATRDSWLQSTLEPGTLAGMLDISVPAHRELLNEVLAGLDRVSCLDADLAKTPQAKAVLAAMVFEGSPRAVAPAEAREIVGWMQTEFQDDLRQAGKSPRHWNLAAADLIGDLHCLRPGLERVHADRLRARRDTGLEELPQPAELEIPLPEQIRSLLSQLEDDEELSGLVRAARQLMAAVTLPRANSDPDEMELGGVSDVSNRGPLDRLLISELAHDDLTLAVRVAMNEALYLRREAPPQNPQRTRVLLLDSGVRSWGLPRVFGTAVALAMAGTLDRHTDLHAYRASDTRAVPLQLATPEGLRSHLAALEAEVHPGLAMESLRKELAALGEDAEPVFILPADAAADADFQAALKRAKLNEYYLATVDGLGRFLLRQRTARGLKTLREARLDLPALFGEKRSAQCVVDGEVDHALPAIFAMRQFPLRLPHGVDPKRIIPLGQDSMLAIAPDRRLMWWDTKKWGAIQLFNQSPPGDVLWSRFDPKSMFVDCLLGIRGNQTMNLLRIDLESRDVKQQEIEVDITYESICSHRGALFIVRLEKVVVYSLETGERLAPVKRRTSLVHIRDRFFKEESSGKWFALSFDGILAQFEFVIDNKTVGSPGLLTLFDRQGKEGPIGITNHGELFSIEQAIRIPVGLELSPPLSVDLISNDGNVVLLTSGLGVMAIVHVDREESETFLHLSTPTSPTRTMQSIIHPRSLRHRFTRIDRNQRNQLILTTRKGVHLALDCTYRDPGSFLSLQPRSLLTLRESQTFKQVKHGPPRGYKLTVSQWQDGSKAFLDSRGLLHLKSSRADLPEVTLVLNDVHLSGWCSDGRMFGEPYFIGDAPAADAAEIYREVIEPFCEQLR